MLLQEEIITFLEILNRKKYCQKDLKVVQKRMRSSSFANKLMKTLIKNTGRPAKVQRKSL